MWPHRGSAVLVFAGDVVLVLPPLRANTWSRGTRLAHAHKHTLTRSPWPCPGRVRSSRAWPRGVTNPPPSPGAPTEPTGKRLRGSRQGRRGACPGEERPRGLQRPEDKDHTGLRSVPPATLGPSSSGTPSPPDWHGHCASWVSRANPLQAAPPALSSPCLSQDLSRVIPETAPSQIRVPGP